MLEYLWKDVFKSNLTKSSEEILREIPIFSSLVLSDLKKVSSLLHHCNFRKDETIFYEKEPGESMYIIKTGEIKITKSVNNKPIQLATLSEGAFFGEISLVDEDIRSATAVATQDTYLLGFFRSDLMKLVDRNPRLASFILFQLARVISKRLRIQSESLKLND